MMRMFGIRPVVAAAFAVGAMSGLIAPGAASAQNHGADRALWSPFAEGFRAGIADERRSGNPAASGPHWNDPFQSESMERLDLARNLLLEVLVTLRRSPPGERRDEALVQAREALIRAQNAMTWLPRDGLGRARQSPQLEHGWGERASGGPRG